MPANQPVSLSNPDTSPLNQQKPVLGSSQLLTSATSSAHGLGAPSTFSKKPQPQPRRKVRMAKPEVTHFDPGPQQQNSHPRYSINRTEDLTAQGPNSQSALVPDLGAEQPNRTQRKVNSAADACSDAETKRVALKFGSFVYLTIERLPQAQCEPANIRPTVITYFRKLQKDCIEGNISLQQFLDQSSRFISDSLKRDELLKLPNAFMRRYQYENGLQREKTNAEQGSSSASIEHRQPSSSSHGALPIGQNPNTTKGQPITTGLVRSGRNTPTLYLQTPRVTPPFVRAGIRPVKSKPMQSLFPFGVTVGESMPTQRRASPPLRGRGVAPNHPVEGISTEDRGNTSANHGTVDNTIKRNYVGNNISGLPMMVGSTSRASRTNDNGLRGRDNLTMNSKLRQIPRRPGFFRKATGIRVADKSSIPPTPSSTARTCKDRDGLEGNIMATKRLPESAAASSSTGKGNGSREGPGKVATSNTGRKDLPNMPRVKSSPSQSRDSELDDIDVVFVSKMLATHRTTIPDTPSTGKRKRAASKVLRPPPYKKRTSTAPAHVSRVAKGAIPAAPLSDNFKNLSISKSATRAVSETSSSGGRRLSVRESHRSVGAQATEYGNAVATDEAGKLGRQVSDEMNVVTGVVDIEKETGQLLVMDSEKGVTVERAKCQSQEMLLDSAKLRAKMQKASMTFLNNRSITRDVMEVVSFAAEERLRHLLEEMKKVASVRLEVLARDWEVEEFGLDVYGYLQKMAEDEEKRLTEAAQQRVRQRNARAEAEAKKKQEEEEASKNAKKIARVEGDAERKGRLALEKNRRECQSQSNALSGLVKKRSQRAKRPFTSASLPPLQPKGKLGCTAEATGLRALPRIGNHKETQNINKTPPLTTLGNKPLVDKREGCANKTVGSLILADALVVIEKDVYMRRSNLAYKWLSRYGLP